MWKRTIDIKPFILPGRTCEDIRLSLVGVRQKLHEELFEDDNPTLQEILDDMDSLLILVRLQPTDVEDAELLQEANQILIKLYEYGDREGIWWG